MLRLLGTVGTAPLRLLKGTGRQMAWAMLASHRGLPGPHRGHR